jgi:hypothetical protein
MATDISADLHGLDYSDKVNLIRTARTYNYSLTASDGGTVSFKVESVQPPLLGEMGGNDYYTIIEPKVKVSSGHTHNGSFTVPKTQLTASESTDQTIIQLTFAREALSDGVNYDLHFEPA